MSQWCGVYLGRVAQVRASDHHVQVQVPQLSGFQVHNWARPMGTVSTPYPKVGDTVLVMFIAGDLQYPVWAPTS